MPVNNRPDFLPHFELQMRYAPHEPQSLEEAVACVLHSGIREITDYDGFPAVQRATAEEIAQHVYESEAGFETALSEYSQQQTSEASANAELLQEDVYLDAVFKGMQRRRAKDTANHLATVVILHQNLATGETSMESRYVERQRSFA